MNPYEKPIADTINGVNKARRKFQSQLLAVASAPCFARVRVGNISPMRIQMPLQQLAILLGYCYLEDGLTEPT